MRGLVPCMCPPVAWEFLKVGWLAIQRNTLIRAHAEASYPKSLGFMQHGNCSELHVPVVFGCLKLTGVCSVAATRTGLWRSSSKQTAERLAHQRWGVYRMGGVSKELDSLIC